MIQLTELDFQIIKRLNQNARLSSAQLAREFSTAERTVRYRLNRLISEGVILPVAVVTPQKFGYNVVVDILCEVDIEVRDKVIEHIKELPQVSYMAFSTGEQDLSIQALFKNTEEMHEFITKKLYTIPGIRRTRSVLVPRIVKDTYHWLPPMETFRDDE